MGKKLKTLESYVIKLDRPKTQWGPLKAEIIPKPERICNELHKELQHLEKYSIPTEKNRRGAFIFDSIEIPENGMYFFFQEDETAHGGYRVVRIGINKTNTLKRRMSNHFRLDITRSAFSTYLIDIYIKYLLYPKLNKWTENGSSNVFTANKFDGLYKVNKKISELEEDLRILRQRKFTGNIPRFDEYKEALLPFFQENFKYSFVWFPDDLKERDLMEDGLIGTVSHCGDCGPSNHWLGLLAPYKLSRKYGLWQRHCLSGKTQLLGEGLNTLEGYMDKTRDNDY